MRRQKWKKWIMATVMAGMLAGQNGYLTVQAAEMPEVGTQEEMQNQEMEIVSLAEEAPEEEIVRASGITYTVDGDTVTITGEGTPIFDYGFWGTVLPKAKHVKFEDCKIIGSMESFFSEKEGSDFAVESVDLSGLDTSDVTSMSEMFRNCTNLISVDMRGIDTSNVTDMWGMFADCSRLTSLDVGDLDTSNVISMSGMFNGCSSLTNLDVSSFDTSNVIDMSTMFYGCSSLTNLDVSGFDTSNVIYMYSMFKGCSSLTNLDVSSFDTSNVSDISSIFGDCNSLVSIDLSSFDLANASYTIGIIKYDTTANMLSGTNIQRIKTPYALGGKYIDLPDTFATSDGRETNRVTADFCNMTLIRKGADVPTIPNTTPAPVPTPVPTPRPEVDEETKVNVNNFVSRMYTVALIRDAEEQGLKDWTERLMSHEVDGAGIANGFIMSDEFKKRNLSDREFVDVLYRTFFNREADGEGRANWLAALAAGKTRGYVLSGFVNSTEFDKLCDSYGIARGTMREDGTPVNPGIRSFVERCYTKVLGRAGEKAGIEDWTNRIATDQMSAEDVAKSFFFSEEYINKKTNNDTFVETLYQAFMDRASDPAGKSDWMGRLNRGTSRQEVLEGFSRSTEFAEILQSYGL